MKVIQSLILNWCYKIGLPLSLAYCFFYFYIESYLNFYGCCFLTGMIATSYWFNCRYGYKCASIIMSYSIYVTIIWGVYVDGGVESVATNFILPAIVLCVMLLGRSRVIWFCVLTVFCLILMAVIPTEYYPDPIASQTARDLYHILIVITSVMVMSYFIYIFIRGYENVIESLSESGESLLEANREIAEVNRELELAAEEASSANKAKSIFLSKMSHELRTPMNAVLGFAQILELDKASFNKEQNENVQEILFAGKHLLTLINELLDLSKIESGKLEIYREVISIAEVLVQCIGLVFNQARERNLKIINNLENSKYRVVADKIRFKQVLLNLLSNAVKYNQTNGEIIIEGQELESGVLKISIIDTGPGLKSEDIKKLFVPFERVNTCDDVEGTGIGLVISKHLIEAQGGSLGVKSDFGKGSEFWLEIKLSI